MSDKLREAALAGPQQAAEPFTPDWTNYRQGLADGWADGYEQGVKDERTSEDNIGIAGFGAKVDPARQNPYGKPQPAQQDTQAMPPKVWPDVKLPKPELPVWRGGKLHSAGFSAKQVRKCAKDYAMSMLNAVPTPPAQQDAQAVPQDMRYTPGHVLVPNQVAWSIVGSTGHARRRAVDALRDLLKTAATPPAQQDAHAVPQGWKLVPVEPTEAMCEEGLEDEGHTIRDGKAFAGALYRAMLNAAPTPPAPKPLGWLDRKAVECLQGPELNWMPAWNRPTSSDPVPIFLSPTARATLTPEEIQAIWSDLVRHVPPVDQPTQVFASAVIEAYERKNGISQPGYTAPDMASQGASQFRAGHDAAQSEIAELEQENRLLRARNDRLQKEIEQKGER